jgi:hypothetical protein
MNFIEHYFTENNREKTITLFRGLEKRFDPNYSINATDAPNGYSTWTDNKDLAKQYAGKTGYVYKIELPKNQLGSELIDSDGDRVLFVNNQKLAGLNGVSGNEYLVYTHHDLYSNNMITKLKDGKESINKNSDNINEELITEMPHLSIDGFTYDIYMEKPDWVDKLIEIIKSKKHNINDILEPFYGLYKIFFVKRFEQLDEKDKQRLKNNLPKQFIIDMEI